MEKGCYQHLGHLQEGGNIPELRRHYFLEEYCIIAAERNRKPTDFKPNKPKIKDSKACPFCPGNEEMTPPAFAVYTEHGVFADGSERIRNWQARVFPNLFSALNPSPSAPTSEWIALSGYGFHEVVVDCPDHGTGPADLSRDQMNLILRVYRDRFCYYRKKSKVRYISIFKNWGEAAGASMIHSHSQIIAVPIEPPLIQREASAISSAPFCPYCSIIDREMASSRLVAVNDSWIMIAPFFSQAPYEMWLLPRAHISNLEYMNKELCLDLALLLRDGLKRIKRLLDDPPFNYMIFQLPSRYHLNVRIQPVLTNFAGFEKSTGICINSVAPEQAASELRQA